jgi:anthranilate synthase component 2
MRILLVDNYDSFTFNIVERLRHLGYTNVTHRYNDAVEAQEALNFEAIILSPGPATPREAGHLCSIIEHTYTLRPLLGICLGHQAIAEVLGAELYNLPQPFHGFQSTLQVTQHGNDLVQPLHNTPIGLYHSWVVSPNQLPNSLHINAYSSEGHIMAIQHKEYPVYGVQFHPESYMTPQGDAVFNAFLKGIQPISNAPLERVV